VKISAVVSVENILIEIELRVHVVFVVFRPISPDVLDRFSQSFHRMKALYVPMMDLYFIFQFVKGLCHGNQIMLP